MFIKLYRIFKNLSSFFYKYVIPKFLNVLHNVNNRGYFLGCTQLFTVFDLSIQCGLSFLLISHQELMRCLWHFNCRMITFSYSADCYYLPDDLEPSFDDEFCVSAFQHITRLFIDFLT